MLAQLNKQPATTKKAQGESQRDCIVISVGGGKGGVGKTLLTANLGICLAKHRLKTVLVDADLGGSNLHTCLGIQYPQVSLSDFVQRRVEKIDDTIVETGVTGLGLISGAQDFLGSANIKYTQKLRLLKQISKIDTDIIILDLGSGSSYNVLDFFLISDLGIVVIVPEPTSLENCYRFIKSAFYRSLRHNEKNPTFRKLIEEAMEDRNSKNIRTPYDLIRTINQMDPVRGRRYLHWLENFRPLLVTNQIRSEEDEELGYGVRMACKKYFGIDLDVLGNIGYDDAVWKAVRLRQALVQTVPNSPIAANIWKIARCVVKRMKEAANQPPRWEES